MSKFYRFLRYGWRHKYLWAIVIFVAVVGFLDPNSFSHRRVNQARIRELKSEISHYQQKFREDTRRLEELKRNPDAMKRIAREKYFMKTANEDIYVIRTRPAGDEATQ